MCSAFVAIFFWNAVHYIEVHLYTMKALGQLQTRDGVAVCKDSWDRTWQLAS
jgi:hypothetical protein